MPEPSDNPVILFDGICKFCHASVLFVIKRDPQKQFRFCSLQSPKGQKLAMDYGIDNSLLTSMVLLEDNHAYTKSGAALRVARKLTSPWPALYILIIMPPFIRDAVYDFIGKHRYQWFGKYDQCMAPDDNTWERFLE